MFKRVFPILFRSQRDRLIRFFAVCKQLYFQTVGTLAVLVICVVPDLLYRRFGLFRFIAVRQRCDGSVDARVTQLITFRQPFFIFLPGVFDFLAIDVQRQVFNRFRPAIVFIQRDRYSMTFPFVIRRIDRRYITFKQFYRSIIFLQPAAQNHIQAFRPLAVPVIPVVPDLDNRQIDSTGIFH